MAQEGSSAGSSASVLPGSVSTDDPMTTEPHEATVHTSVFLFGAYSGGSAFTNTDISLERVREIRFVAKSAKRAGLHVDVPENSRVADSDEGLFILQGLTGSHRDHFSAEDIDDFFPTIVYRVANCFACSSSLASASRSFSTAPSASVTASF